MNKMKMKSIVFTVALASAFSAFSDSATVNSAWFSTNDTSVAYFDRDVNNPVVITHSVTPATVNVTGYSITAYVTNLVVFASKPSTPGKYDSKSAMGSICAAYDSSASANKWYGLASSGWTALTGLGTPAENTSYALKMEFKNDSGAEVRYSVNGIAHDGWLAAPGEYKQPNWYAFAGMGGCTNIVGEVEITVANSTAVSVDGGQIIVANGSVTSDNANNNANNGLKYWVNYVLGISNDGTATVDKKPFAAPEQNSDTDKLTFRLGGVVAENVRGQSETGAKVTYTVEELASPTDSSGTEGTYVGPGETVDVTLDSNSVKYYRIKIKIDPAH